MGAKGIAVLKEWCPQFLEEELDPSTHATCCSVEQLQTLDKNIKLAANFLKRCPSCMNNLAKHLCYFTCSPGQSNFMNVSVKVDTKDNKTVEYVDAMDLYIKSDYMEGTFNSCKQVSVPSTGQLALDLMCGSWGSRSCSAQRWFSFMGDTNENPYTPFQINYKNTTPPNGPFTLVNPASTPCNVALSVSIIIT